MNIFIYLYQGVKTHLIIRYIIWKKFKLLMVAILMFSTFLPVNFHSSSMDFLRECCELVIQGTYNHFS